ncbi:MIF factor, partial [Polyodon spathula]|nr:MIF factor [Polyodon spathula]
MPMFVMKTNVSKDAVPPSLLSEATQELSKAMGKPVKYIAVHIATDQMMMFGGKADPCALCSLHSIGKISGQENKLYSKLLCGLINKHLGISVDRYSTQISNQHATLHARLSLPLISLWTLT